MGLDEYEDIQLTEAEEVKLKELLCLLTPERLDELCDGYPPPAEFWTELHDYGVEAVNRETR